MKPASNSSLLGNPTFACVAPFVVFMAMMLLGPLIPIGVWEQPLRVAILGAAIWIFSRGVLDFRVRSLPGSVAIGIAVFLVWIAPDLLIPGYREHWLFRNSITGATGAATPLDQVSDPVFLIFRSLRAVILVPIIEELFWRGWLIRWIINPDFQKVPLGAYAASAFWITALLFASEHGVYWDVGLAAGILYNWWMVRTRSLGDLILAHGITNALLSGYTIATGNWEYWM